MDFRCFLSICISICAENFNLLSVFCWINWTTGSGSRLEQTGAIAQMFRTKMYEMMWLHLSITAHGSQVSSVRTRKKCFQPADQQCMPTGGKPLDVPMQKTTDALTSSLPPCLRPWELGMQRHHSFSNRYLLITSTIPIHLPNKKCNELEKSFFFCLRTNCCEYI